MASRGRPEAPALRPGVLDRLMAPVRGGAAGQLEAVGVRELQAAVARDLDWLLNSKRWLVELPDELPQASDSILGYGLPDLSLYSWRSPGDAVSIARALEEAIRRFEPRLRPQSVRVTPLAGADAADFRLRFRIDAVLYVEPVNTPVAFDTDVDLGASRVEVRGAP